METTLTQITSYLATQSWQIAVLAAAIAAVSLLLRNKSAHVRYLLWLVVLAKCLTPPLLTIPLAVLPQQQVAPPAPVVPAEIPALTIEPVRPVTYERPATLPIAPPVIEQPSIGRKLSGFAVRQWLPLTWIAGLSLFFSVNLIKAFRTNYWLRRARRPLPAGLQKSIDKLFTELGIRRPPRLWLVKDIGQPFVWGLLRGGIYLPADFAKLDSPKHRRGILGHELSHVLRFDAAVNLLQVIVQAIFWFHPFVWWANKKIRAEREKCCDEMAIARLGAKAKDYSTAIVNTLIAEHRAAKPIPSLAVAGPVKNIEDRIKTILKPNKKFYKRPTFIVIAAVAVAAAITVPTTLALTSRPQKKTDVQVEGKIEEDNEIKTVTLAVLDEDSLDKIDSAMVSVFDFSSEEIIGINVDLKGLTEREKGNRFFNAIFAAEADLLILDDGEIVVLGPSTAEIKRMSLNEISKIGVGSLAAHIRAEEKRRPKGFMELPFFNPWLNPRDVGAFLTEDGLVVAIKAGEFREGAKKGKFKYIIVGKVDPQNLPEPKLITKLAIRNKLMGVLEYPEFITNSAKGLFEKIQNADYDYFLNSKDPQAWKEFPIVESYKAYKEYPGLVRWICKTFKGNAIASIKLGEVNASEKDWPSIGYRLVLKDGSTIDGSLSFEYHFFNDNDGRWYGIHGIDWHLQDEPIKKANVHVEVQQKQFKATLPNGVTVELVGVCEYPGKGRQWWRPDGTELKEKPPFADEYRERLSHLPFDEGVERRVMLLLHWAGDLDPNHRDMSPNLQLQGVQFNVGEEISPIDVEKIIDGPSTLGGGDWGFMFTVLRTCRKMNASVGAKYLVDNRPEVRHQWVTFQNVSLRPNFKTDVQVEIDEGQHNKHIRDHTKEQQKQFIATLPNGVTVELVGVCEYDGESKGWLKPDGTVFDPDLHVQTRKEYKGQNRLAFVVKLSTEDFNLEFNIKGVQSYSGMHVYDATGNVLHNYKAAVALIENNNDFTDLRIGAATAPWETIAECDGDGRFATGVDTVFSTPIESKMGTAISVRGDWDRDLGERRVIAIDKQGKTHIGSWYGRSSWDKTISMSEFKKILPEQIEKYELQLRPYEWVEFKNVSLRPGLKTDVHVEVGRASEVSDADKMAAEDMAAEGWQLWQERKLAEAERLFKKAVEEDPTNANAWNGLGWSQQNQGKLLNAKVSFERCLQIEPTHAAALNGLGWIAKAQGKTDEAIGHWEKAVAAAPGATAALNGLATTYMESKQYDNAIKYYEMWLDVEPDNSQAKTGLQEAKAESADVQVEVEETSAKPATGTRQAHRRLELFYDDGSSEGRRSIPDGGHAVMFDAPGEGYLLTAVSLHCRPAGASYDPAKNFRIWLLDDQFNLIKDFTFRYSDLTRRRNTLGRDWVKLLLQPVEVPATFIICVGFDPTPQKAIYLGYDSSGTASSFVGLPGQTMEPFTEGQWMIRAVLEQSAENIVSPDASERPNVQVDAMGGEGESLRVYEVNRRVSYFPEVEDFSTPEAAYAAINRVSASGDASGWQRVSVKRLAERLAGEKDRGKMEVGTEWAKVLLNAQILEVRIWKGKYAMVLAELPQEYSSEKIREPIDLRSLEFEDGRWLNAGNDRAWTVEQGRAIFVEAVEYRKREAEKELVRKRIEEAIKDQEEVVQAAEELFEKIRSADYDYFLEAAAAGWKKGEWHKFPTVNFYMVHRDYPAFVRWSCENFKANPIVSVEVGQVFIGDKQIKGKTGWPTVPYKLTLRDGGVLEGNLAFEYNFDGGVGHWHGMEGIDWHLQDEPIKKPDVEGEPGERDETKGRVKSVKQTKTPSERRPTNEGVYKQLEKVFDLSKLPPEMHFADALDVIKNSVKPPLNVFVFWNDLYDEANVDRTSPINIDSDAKVPLKMTFNLLLDSVSGGLGDLTYTVANGLIYIGPKQSLRKKVKTSVHRISDVIGAPATATIP